MQLDACSWDRGNLILKKISELKKRFRLTYEIKNLAIFSDTFIIFYSLEVFDTKR